MKWKNKIKHIKKLWKYNNNTMNYMKASKVSNFFISIE